MRPTPSHCRRRARLGAGSLARLLVALRRSPKAQKPSASNNHELGSGAATVTFTLLSTQLAIKVVGMLSIKRAIGRPSGSLNSRLIVLSTTLKILVVATFLILVTSVSPSLLILSAMLMLLSMSLKIFVTASLSITMLCDVGVSKTALCEGSPRGPVVTLILLSMILSTVVFGNLFKRVIVTKFEEPVRSGKVMLLSTSLSIVVIGLLSTEPPLNAPTGPSICMLIEFSTRL